MRHSASSPPKQWPADAKGRTRFIVVLEGSSGAGDAHVRTLRHLLKFLLRSRGLHCIEARQVNYRHDDDGGER